MLTAPTATALASSACTSDYKRKRAAGAVVVSSRITAGALSLSDTKETMRATLEIALLLLAGYFTLTDGVSELLHIIILTHTSSNTSTC